MDYTEQKTGGQGGLARNIHINVKIMIMDVIRNLAAIGLISAILAGVFYVVRENTVVPSYKSSATFMLSSSEGNIVNLKASGTLLEEIMGSSLMKKIIAEDLGLDSTTVPATITTMIQNEGSIVNVTVTAASPRMAFQVLDSLSHNYRQVSDYLMEGMVLEVIEPAVIPMYSTTQSGARELFKKVFLYAAAFLTAGVLVLSYFRDTIKTEADITEKIDAPLFAIVSRQTNRGQNALRLAKRSMRVKKSILINGIQTSFGFVESFKKIRTKIENEARKNDCRVIMVTSVMENEGKSTVAANIAIALAQKSDKVLLMDADFRKPAQFKVLDAERQEKGLGDVLMKECTLEDVIRMYEPAGMYCLYNYKTYRNSSELLLSKEMSELVKMLREKMDYVIIDTPPTGMVADAEIVSNIADGSLLVVREDCSQISEINDTVDMLSGHHSKMLGCIYNFASGSIGSAIQGGDAYGYGSYGKHGRYGKYGNYGYGSYRKEQHTTAAPSDAGTQQKGGRA